MTGEDIFRVTLLSINILVLSIAINRLWTEKPIPLFHWFDWSIVLHVRFTTCTYVNFLASFISSSKCSSVIIPWYTLKTPTFQFSAINSWIPRRLCHFGSFFSIAFVLWHLISEAMDDEDSDVALPPCESTTGKALRRGEGVMKAAGVGMGFRKRGTLKRFTLEEDMLIITHMVNFAYPKYGIGIGNLPSIVDCVAAHPKVHTVPSIILWHSTFGCNCHLLALIGLIDQINWHDYRSHYNTHFILL